MIWVWNGFLSLSSSRSIGMAGPLHITYNEILSYCELYDITNKRKKEDFADFIRILDNIWIEDYYTKEERRRKAEENSRNNKKR